jgi:hypothetical protein
MIRREFWAQAWEEDAYVLSNDIINTKKILNIKLLLKGIEPHPSCRESSSLTLEMVTVYVGQDAPARAEICSQICSHRPGFGDHRAPQTIPPQTLPSLIHASLFRNT